MKIEQTFTFMGIPKAQPRSRSKHIKTKDGREFNINYDPSDAKQYKQNLAAQVVNQNPEFIEQGVPIRLDALCYLPRPKNHFRANGSLKDWAPVYCLGKPDEDNLRKAIKDALKGILWHDDSQVVRGETPKFYAKSEPKVIIKVTRLPKSVDDIGGLL